MGCGCRKNTVTSNPRRTVVAAPNNNRLLSTQLARTPIVNAQLQAQALGINLPVAQMDAINRKSAKLRRDAIRRALNK